MKDHAKIVVVGLGEVGKPLFELVCEHYDTVGVDIEPNRDVKGVYVMHICYPFQIADFVGESLRYIELYEPKLTIINSTVTVGTTRTIARDSGAAVAYSPVRGKHACMLEDMRRYVKFVGAPEEAAAKAAASHFRCCGLSTRILASPETAELAKLTETSYFGLLIAWAQDVERACDQLGVSYDEVTSFYEEVKFFSPVKYFPGVICGHCVMPNIELLRQALDSQLLDAIRTSNKKKIERDAIKAESLMADRKSSNTASRIEGIRLET